MAGTQQEMRQGQQECCQCHGLISSLKNLEMMLWCSRNCQKLCDISIEFLVIPRVDVTSGFSTEVISHHHMIVNFILIFLLLSKRAVEGKHGLLAKGFPPK